MALMKYLNMLICFLISQSVLAQSQFEAVGIPVMKAAVVSSFAKAEDKSGCAAGGVKYFDKILQVQGDAVSSMQVIMDLIDKSRQSHRQLEADASHCGSCQQVNEVAVYLTSEPAKVSRNSMCDNMPTVNVQVLLAESEVQGFVEATLSGNSSHGKKLFLGCPDPCSFYTAFASTPKENNKRLLNLTSHCGQPRNGSLMFAKYKFTAGLIQKWSCQ